MDPGHMARKRKHLQHQGHAALSALIPHAAPSPTGRLLPPWDHAFGATQWRRRTTVAIGMGYATEGAICDVR